MANVDEQEVLRRASQLASICPSPEATRQAIGRARAAVMAAAGARCPHAIRRAIVRSGIAAAVLIGVVVLVLILADNGATVAFADVRKRIERARTMVYTERFSSGPAEQPSVRRHWIKEPGLMRWEVIDDGDGQISITDRQRGRQLLIWPKRKLATLRRFPGLSTRPGHETTYSGGIRLYVQLPEGAQSADVPAPQAPGPQPPTDFLAQLKRLVKQAETPLGDKKINGRPAKGFHLGKAPNTLEIWVDAQTGHPVLIEQRSAALEAELRVVMTDFEIDKDLDDSLFSTDPPAGYKFYEHPSIFTPITEKDLAEGLGVLAKFNKGLFPETPYLTPAIPDPAEMARMPEDERTKVFEQISMVGLFCQKLPPGSVWGYTGKGAKLGDSEKRVLWYWKLGAEAPRSVHGDLSVRDMAPAEAPNKPVAPKSGTEAVTPYLPFTGMMVTQGKSPAPSTTQPTTQPGR